MILPLYDQTPITSAPPVWHQVRAPGGYEIWRFMAADPARELWAIASLSWGSPLCRDDFHRYLRYRRQPTRYPPPVPYQNCSASFALFASGKQIAGLNFRGNGEQFSISGDQLRLGESALTIDSAGCLHLQLHGTLTASSRKTTAKLVLEPQTAASLPEIELTTSPLPAHRLFLNHPICKASCEVSTGSPANVVNFRGFGSSEHAWGIRPPACDFAWSFSAYMLDDHGTIRFECVAPRSAPPLARLLEIDGTEARDQELPADLIGWRRIGMMRRKFPARAQFGQQFILEYPKLLAISPSDIYLTCQARLPTREGSAFCQLIDYQRFFPVFCPSRYSGRWQG